MPTALLYAHNHTYLGAFYSEFWVQWISGAGGGSVGNILHIPGAARPVGGVGGQLTGDGDATAGGGWSEDGMGGRWTGDSDDGVGRQGGRWQRQWRGGWRVRRRRTDDTQWRRRAGDR